jgi:hypothetical protein
MLGKDPVVTTAVTANGELLSGQKRRYEKDREKILKDQNRNAMKRKKTKEELS